MANQYTALNPEINYCVLCIEMMQVGTPVKPGRSTVCKGLFDNFSLDILKPHIAEKENLVQHHR
jgi:hypothetical protein